MKFEYQFDPLPVLFGKGLFSDLLYKILMAGYLWGDNPELVPVVPRWQAGSYCLFVCLFVLWARIFYVTNVCTNVLTFQVLRTWLIFGGQYWELAAASRLIAGLSEMSAEPFNNQNFVFCWKFLPARVLSCQHSMQLPVFQGSQPVAGNTGKRLLNDHTCGNMIITLSDLFVPYFSVSVR